MKIRLDKADTTFSQYIRTRDSWSCVRCGMYYAPPTTSLQCSHYFGRGKESTRFDPENCDALCWGCHHYWGSVNREDYRNFKIKQLGQKGFDALTLRANSYKKKDRKMAYLEAKELLKSLGKA